MARPGGPLPGGAERALHSPRNLGPADGRFRLPPLFWLGVACEGKTACLRNFHQKESSAVYKRTRSCSPSAISAGPRLAHPGQTDHSTKRDDSGLVTCAQALLSVHQSMTSTLAGESLPPGQLSPGFTRLHLSLSTLYPRASHSGPQISISAKVAQQGSPR